MSLGVEANDLFVVKGLMIQLKRCHVVNRNTGLNQLLSGNTYAVLSTGFSDPTQSLNGAVTNGLHSYRFSLRINGDGEVELDWNADQAHDISLADRQKLIESVIRSAKGSLSKRLIGIDPDPAYNWTGMLLKTKLKGKQPGRTQTENLVKFTNDGTITTSFHNFLAGHLDEVQICNY